MRSSGAGVGVGVVGEKSITDVKEQRRVVCYRANDDVIESSEMLARDDWSWARSSRGQVTGKPRGNLHNRRRRQVDLLDAATTAGGNSV